MTHYQIICFVWFTTFAVPISIVFMHLRIIELPFFFFCQINQTQIILTHTHFPLHYLIRISFLCIFCVTLDIAIS